MQKKCFVVIGYGEKTDYFTGRVLNLDKTYEDIIKPLVESLNMECIRADEIKHSGVIDKAMYEALISADVVIADLSTYNANVFYELGIRHALKPYTTIIISEEELRYPFDIEHVVVHKYEHLGKDIGYSEVIRFKKEMRECIEGILNNPDIDSPVYTYLSNLKPPKFENEKYEQNEENVDKSDERTLKSIVGTANDSLKKNEFIQAKSLYEVALNIDKDNDYLIQKIVLCTYKSEYPTRKESLINAIDILEKLSPESSNDVETLGLASAIYKRLWELERDEKYLNLAIDYSERGFFIGRDYYNGINLAYLFNVRGDIHDGDELIADFMIAKRIRKKIIEICLDLIEKNFESRSDCYWILATMEEAYFGTENKEKYNEYKERAIKNSCGKWQLDTTESQINKLNDILIKQKE